MARKSEQKLTDAACTSNNIPMLRTRKWQPILMSTRELSGGQKVSYSETGDGDLEWNHYVDQKEIGQPIGQLGGQPIGQL